MVIQVITNKIIKLESKNITSLQKAFKPTTEVLYWGTRSTVGTATITGKNYGRKYATVWNHGTN